MGIFDELNKTLKQAEKELKEANIDRQLKELEQGLNKAGRDLSQETGKASGTTAQPAGQPAVQPVKASPHPQAGTRTPRTGYAKITAWVKTKYSSRLAGITDPRQKKLALEQITTETCSGLPAKTKNGFLDYLKNQNLEQLLR